MRSNGYWKLFPEAARKVESWPRTSRASSRTRRRRCFFSLADFPRLAVSRRMCCFNVITPRPPSSIWLIYRSGPADLAETSWSGLGSPGRAWNGRPSAKAQAGSAIVRRGRAAETNLPRPSPYHRYSTQVVTVGALMLIRTGRAYQFHRGRLRRLTR